MSVNWGRYCEDALVCKGCGPRLNSIVKIIDGFQEDCVVNVVTQY